MRRQLPPFGAVRAFEASARHLSFKKAAEELCLTQSAVSHQVKSLENYLGTQLFYRGTRGVALTPEGASYLAGVTDILDRMAAETARVSRCGIGGTLSVRAAPGFVRWLLPRLAGFQNSWPDIELHLSSSLAYADFASEDIDVNVRWGYEPHSGLLVTPLIASSRHPIISPELLRRGQAPSRPQDLLQFTLLHEGRCRNFEKWFDFAGVCMENSRRGLSFANYDHVVTAAIEGQGVALGYDAVVSDDIEAGRLVSLFDIEFPKRILYSLAIPKSWEERPRIRAFRTWLIGETEGLPAANCISAMVAANDVWVHAHP